MPAQRTTEQLAETYRDAAQAIAGVAEQYPGSYVVRNEAGNLAVMTRDGTYTGYIDVLTGEVDIF